MTTRRTLPAAALAGLLLAAAGCENPFDPAADLRFQWFVANAGQVEQIAFTDVQNGTAKTNLGSIQMIIDNYSSVPVRFTSYTVVYRQISAQSVGCVQPAGSAICSLGGAAGRRFPMTEALGRIAQNSAPFVSSTFFIWPITNELIDYIASDPSVRSGGIDMDIVMYGTDQNGHDVKVGGTLHMEIY